MKNSVVMNITKVYTEILSIMRILSGKVIVDISLKKNKQSYYVSFKRSCR